MTTKLAKSAERPPGFCRAFENLVAAARATVNYEFVRAEKWQPPGSRRSVISNLERALHEAEAALKRAKR